MTQKLYIAISDEKKERFIQLSSIICHRNLDLAIIVPLFMAAGLLNFSGNVRNAAIIQGISMVVIAILAASREDRAYNALILIPLLGLVGASMPVFLPSSLDAYTLIYGPMLIPIYLILKSGKFTPGEIGLRMSGMAYYLPISMILGLALGYIEYLIIRPESLISDQGLYGMLRLSSVMLLIGFVEEFVYRSSVQTVLEERLGSVSGLIVVSIFYGCMYGGYGKPAMILFGLCAGLIMGLLFIRKRSLIYITIAHGVANISLFIIASVIPMNFIDAINLGFLHLIWR